MFNSKNMNSIANHSTHSGNASNSEESEQETRYAQSKRLKHGHSVFDLVTAEAKRNIIETMSYSSDISDTEEEDNTVVEKSDNIKPTINTTKLIVSKRQRKYARSVEARERRWQRKQLKRSKCLYIY
jgi:hypothetical protein